jgi:hypothetical protein
MGGLLFCGKKIKNSIEKNLKKFKKNSKKFKKNFKNFKKKFIKFLADGWMGGLAKVDNVFGKKS